MQGMHWFRLSQNNLAIHPFQNGHSVGS